MDDVQHISRGIFGLPNEILLQVFDVFSTRELVQQTTVCRKFHSVILRLIQTRLQVAAGLDGHLLYLECHTPATRFTSPKLFCLPLGTEGIELLQEGHSDDNCVGHIAKCGQLFSRFRPQRTENSRILWRVPGDIQGSRTYRAAEFLSEGFDPNEIVSATVSIDAHELFSQLVACTYLGQRESSRDILRSIKEVSDGTIRVWRPWLAKHCESKRWTDGEPITVIHDTNRGESSGGEGACFVGENGYPDPTKDPTILWINTQKQNVGIKFKVRERKWRRTEPVQFASEEEVPVSYQVDYEEVLVRTTHLLLKLEDAQEQMDNQYGKAIIFGSYRG